MRDSLMDDDGHSIHAPKKHRLLFTLFWVLLGAGVATAIILVVEHTKSSDDTHNACPSGPVVPPYNKAEYDRLDAFYSNFTSVPFTQLDNLRADRVGAGIPNPVYPRLIVYTRTQYYLPHANASTTTLWITILSTNITNTVNISKPFQLTQPRWGIQDQSPQWTKDGKAIVFLSNRNQETSQLYHLRLPETIFTDYTPLADVMTTTAPFTQFPISIDNFLLSPTNDVIAFSVQVYPSKNMTETVAILQQQQASGVEAQLYEKLYMRHWDEWFQCRPGLGCLRNHPHLLSITLSDSGITVHDVKDILYGYDADSPVRPFGGIEQWSFNSRGRIFAFTRQQSGKQETTTVAFGTDLNIHTIAFDITNTSQLVLDTNIICRTCENRAEDTNPSFAPGLDQSHILAYLAMEHPQYESDRLRVRVLDLSTNYLWNLTKDETNYSFTSLIWQPPSIKGGNSTKLYLSTESFAQDLIFTVDLYDGLPSKRLWLPSEGSVSNFVVSPDGNYAVHTWSSMTFPPTLAIYTFSTGLQTEITTHNQIWNQKVNRVDNTNIERIKFTCSNGDSCYGWVMKPLHFNPNKTYPMALLIHGGPQGAWVDSWSYRWNPQNYATFNDTDGFVTVMINPHGSTGYGQQFTDDIVGRYGSWPFQDLTQYGMSYLKSNFSFIDDNRVVALGASYGGYMINWIAGQPEAAQFKALVSHDGMFDIRSFYYSTEEVYFPEHDNEGVTPYQNLTKYEEWSPVNYVANWTQPMLVIHGGHDYRIPEAQGISVYTATQRLGIEGCQFMYFPNENHWVLKNANSVFWHDTVLAFIAHHTRA